VALAPADFYAYSRATGVPVPEDPEERAQMAPEVLEFRRNQLRGPQEESNLPGIIGASLAGLGALGAGYLGMRRLGGKRLEAQSYEPLNRAGVEGVKRVAEPKASRPAPSKPPVQYQEAAVKPSTVDLTTIKQQQQPVVSAQHVEALDSGLDQAVNNISVIPEQRQVNGFKAFSQDVDRIIREAQLQETVQKFPTEVANVAQARQQVVSGNPWELEELLEEGGRQMQSVLGAQYERGGRTVADLTGELEVSPALGKQLRKSGINVRGGRGVQLSQFSDTPAREGIGVNRFTPNEILERTMAAASYPREVRDMLLNPAVKLSDVIPLGPIEARDTYLNKYVSENADRLYESNVIKNPALVRKYASPEQQTLAEFLGRTPQVRGGAVSINPTMEIAGGARASMTDAPVEELQTATVGGRGLTYADTTDLKQLQQKEQLEKAGYSYDPNTGNFTQDADIPEIDPTEYMTRGPEMGTDYGDTEGVGNLLIETESFRERTNQGTTQIPGAVQQTAGLRGGSERQERAADVVMPLRRTAEGQQTSGLRVVADPEMPFGRQLRLQDVGYRQGGRLVSEDLSAQGSKLVGGFETSQPTVSDVISTMPLTEWRKEGGIIRGADGNLYSAVGMEVVGEQPLVGIKRTPLLEVDPSTGQQRRVGFTTPKEATLQPVTLSRQELQQVAEDAKNAYFNNPSIKLKYLQENNPNALELGRAQGKTLSEIGEPYDYQGFITQQVDKYLMENKGIDLPILKPQVDEKTGETFLNKKGSTFAMNLLKTEKNTPIYGERFLVDPNTGRRVPKRDEQGKVVTNKGGYIQYETTGEKVPVPGAYDVTGGGGLDPMTISDEYNEGSVSYYTPRIDTASQQKVLQQTKALGIPADTALGMTSTPTGAQMSILRAGMETPQTGVGMRTVPTRDPRTGNVVGRERVSTINIGSFARTQNPYTGPAAPAMGPASRVERGDYQYTDPQLSVNIEPRSPSQQRARNQFALAANLTPGGRVKMGALNLGAGLGTIEAGVGALTDSEAIARYGLTGRQLQQFGNRLMSQAAYRRGLGQGPTSISAI